MIIRSSLCAMPPDQPRAPAVWSKTLTNCAPCNRSIGVGKVNSDSPTSAVVLSSSDQNTPCTSGSSPAIPNSA